MKKIATFFSVVAVAATVFVSCSKKGDYICTCTIDGQSVESGVMTDVKKSDAEKTCDAAADQAKLLDPNATCSVSEK